MSHDQSKITGLRKAERTRSARTPDRSDVRTMDASMMSTTFSSPKRKIHTSRLSMMPPASLNTTNVNLRKLELENNNLELELIYSEYVASHAELILEKKILKDTEVSFSNSIKSLHEETKLLQEKYKLLETRKRDIIAYSSFNDYMDVIQQNGKDFKDRLDKHEIKNILLQLENELNRFNVLRCENVIIPNSAEELQQFKKTLKDCYTILQQISDPIACDTLENVAVNYEDFVTMYNDFTNVKKIVEEKICSLQSEILRTCSHVLSQGD